LVVAFEDDGLGGFGDDEGVVVAEEVVVAGEGELEFAAGEDGDGGEAEAGWFDLEIGIDAVEEVEEFVDGVVEGFGDEAAAVGLVDAVEEGDPVAGGSGALDDGDEFAVGGGEGAAEVELGAVDGDGGAAGEVEEDGIAGDADPGGGEGLVVGGEAQAEEFGGVGELGAGGGEESGGGEEEGGEFHGEEVGVPLRDEWGDFLCGDWLLVIGYWLLGISEWGVGGVGGVLD